MVRNVSGLAVIGFVAVIAWKLLAAIFGVVIGLVLTIMWWAFLAFVVYTLLKIFAPGTAAKVRQTVRGNSSGAA